MSKYPSRRQNAFGKTKLARLLGILSGEELDSFNKFLVSSWFNGSRKIYSIFKKIRPYHPEYDSPRLTHQSIFKKTFPGEVFNHHKLKKYLSELCILLQRFMAQQALEKDDDLRQELVARFLGQHGRYGLLEEHHKAAMQKLERQPTVGAAVFGQQFKLMKEVYFHPECKKFPGAEAMLPGMMDALDREYALHKLFLACEAMNAAHFTQQEIEVPMLGEVQKFVKANLGREYPVFEIFLKLSYLLQGEGDKQMFGETIQLAKAWFDQMEYRERTAAISLLINYAIQAYRETSSKWWLMKLNDLYRFGLGKEMFLYRGKMKESTFSNICNTVVLAGDFDFAEQFIQKHGECLDEKIKKETIALAEAFLWFHMGQGKAAHERLLNTRFVSLRHKLVARPLILRCLYAMQLEGENLNSTFHHQLSAFEKFVRTNKTLSSGHKKPYLSFVSIFRRMANCPLQGEQRDKISDKLRIELENGSPVVAKSWLLAEIGLIGKSRGADNDACPSARVTS